MNKGCKLVLRTVRNAEKLLSAQEIHDQLRQNLQRPPSLTTVYRALDTLVKDGELTILNTLESERRYAATQKESCQHHIICKSCYVALPISDCSLGNNAKTTAQEHGFKLESHLVEFYGTCSACSDQNDDSFNITNDNRLFLASF